jgi:hypothetical protein
MPYIKKQEYLNLQQCQYELQKLNRQLEQEVVISPYTILFLKDKMVKRNITPFKVVMSPTVEAILNTHNDYKSLVYLDLNRVYTIFGLEIKVDPNVEGILVL